MYGNVKTQLYLVSLVEFSLERHMLHKRVRNYTYETPGYKWMTLSFIT